MQDKCPRPAEINRMGSEGLEIVWNNGERSLLTSKLLRSNCPSADSLAARGVDTHSKPLTPKKSPLTIINHSIDDSLRLVRIWSVGNYAIGVEWGDGHKSGIYSFELLHHLSTLQD